MTISSTARVAGPFVGAGSTATFPFTFKVFDESDLYVVEQTVATGAIAALTLNSDYSVALNADQDSSPGGSITLTAGNLATGYWLAITTDIAALQGLDLTNGGGFYPAVINGALDLLTVLVQQLLEQTQRAMQVPITESGASMALPAAVDRAGKLLMFDASGNLTLIPVAAGSGVPGSQSATGTVDGNNDTFTFAAASGTAPAAMVFAGGVYQPPDEYTGPTDLGAGIWRIVFNTAPNNGPVKIVLFA